MKDYCNDDTLWTDECRYEFEKESLNVITIRRLLIPIVVEQTKHSAQNDDKKVFINFQE